MLIIVSTLVIIFVMFIGLRYTLGREQNSHHLESAINLEICKAIKKDPKTGLAIGIYKSNKVFLQFTGVTDRDLASTPDDTTVFQIGSISKVFTTSILQSLCDEGVINLDSTLEDLLSETISLAPNAKSVTLRQLATHTSGFPSIPKSIGNSITELVGKAHLLDNPYSHLSPEQIFDYLAHCEDKRPAGRFVYSNYGMGLLGHILEKVTDQSLESLIQERILTPLDMHNTAISLNTRIKQHLAQGYSAKLERQPIWTFNALAGAGALNSDIHDMMKFVRANIENNDPLAKLLKKTHQKQCKGKTGLGWIQPSFLDKVFGNKSIVWHNGMVGGYASYLSIDTVNKIGVVVLSNKAVDVTMLGMMLTRRARKQP